MIRAQFPTAAQVEKATREQLRAWLRNLPLADSFDELNIVLRITTRMSQTWRVPGVMR